jgi:hypothetical protein
MNLRLKNEQPQGYDGTVPTQPQRPPKQKNKFVSFVLFSKNKNKKLTSN